MSGEDTLLADFKAINETLKAAKEYGLEAEVMWSALRHQTICTDISESCQVGLDNWDI
jgi:hypothetical protein